MVEVGTGASHLKSGYTGFVEARTDRPARAGAFALGRVMVV